MARTRPSTRIPTVRRLGACALGIAALATSLSLAGPALAEDPAAPVETCVSSVVTDGAIQTSAMVVTRDQGTHAPAEGWETCTVG